MANNNIGLWVNYATKKIYEIDEHERYIRRGNNARKIGVPDFVIEEFGEFKPVEDRDKFLLFVIDKSPLIRVREHGNYATFEFSARKSDKVFEAIKKVGDYLGFGMLTGLYVVNHADNSSASLTWEDFQKASQWADKVSELTESSEMFVPKKLFANIFDYVESAKVMTESQKMEIGILGYDKRNDSIEQSMMESIKNDDEINLMFDFGNHATIFNDNKPICYIEDFERWNFGLSKYAFDPNATDKEKEEAVKWMKQRTADTGKMFIEDGSVLKRHLYYNDVVLNKKRKR